MLSALASLAGLGACMGVHECLCECSNIWENCAWGGGGDAALSAPAGDCCCPSGRVDRPTLQWTLHDQRRGPLQA